MIKDSGPKRVSILINRAQRPGGLGAGPYEKRFRAKKSRLNLQSKLLHAGFTRSPCWTVREDLVIPLEDEPRSGEAVNQTDYRWANIST